MTGKDFTVGGYLIPFGNEIDVIAQLSPLITSDVLDDIKRKPKMVATKHVRQDGRQNVKVWFDSRQGKFYEGILKGIYIKKTAKHLFITSSMLFNGEKLIVVIYNDSTLPPFKLKMETQHGVFGPMIPLAESIKVKNCQVFVQ